MLKTLATLKRSQHFYRNQISKVFSSSLSFELISLVDLGYFGILRLILLLNGLDFFLLINFINQIQLEIQSTYDLWLVLLGWYANLGDSQRAEVFWGLGGFFFLLPTVLIPTCLLPTPGHQ